MLKVPYRSERFPYHFGSEFRGSNICNCTWHELIWAAITVGKADRLHLLRHGRHSIFELIYRSSIIFSNLKQDSKGFIRRSNVYGALDPSEKGAISYFLGLTFAKLFVEKYLKVPWLMHLDVYHTQLRPTLSPGRSKPDLVGMTTRGDWIVMEAKGRSGSLTSDVLKKAKNQTRKLRRIGESFPSTRVALACYFSGDRLKIKWEDPDEYDEDAADIILSRKSIILDYYRPFMPFVQSDTGHPRRVGNQFFKTITIEEADLEIGIGYDAIEWIKMMMHEYDDFHFPDSMMGYAAFSNVQQDNVKVGSDGIFVRLGDSWNERTMKEEVEMR